MFISLVSLFPKQQHQTQLCFKLNDIDIYVESAKSYKFSDFRFQLESNGDRIKCKYNVFTYLESIFSSRSNLSRCNSRKWNRFNRATGGMDMKQLPLIDKYDKFDNFDNCCVGTICKLKYRKILFNYFSANFFFKYEMIKKNKKYQKRKRLYKRLKNDKIQKKKYILYVIENSWTF